MAGGGNTCGEGRSSTLMDRSRSEKSACAFASSGTVKGGEATLGKMGVLCAFSDAGDPAETAYVWVWS